MELKLNCNLVEVISLFFAEDRPTWLHLLSFVRTFITFRASFFCFNFHHFLLGMSFARAVIVPYRWCWKIRQFHLHRSKPWNLEQLSPFWKVTTEISDGWWHFNSWQLILIGPSKAPASSGRNVDEQTFSDKPNYSFPPTLLFSVFVVPGVTTRVSTSKAFPSRRRRLLWWSEKLHNVKEVMNFMRVGCTVWLQSCSGRFTPLALALIRIESRLTIRLKIKLKINPLKIGNIL